MRVTFASVNRNVQRNLSRRYSDMVNLQEQLATGKRLRKASDDPIDSANNIKLRTKLNQLDQYKRNIEDGLAVMNVSSSAMQSMNEMLHRARELAVQAANGTYTDADRTYMQKEVDQIFRQMMSVINTQFKGNYIFNGTQTKIPPFELKTSDNRIVDYTNRTMATYGQEFDTMMVDGADHAARGDGIYLDFTHTNVEIGSRVQLYWAEGTTPLVPTPPHLIDADGRPLQNIVPETFPLDTYHIWSFVEDPLNPGTMIQNPMGPTPFHHATQNDDGTWTGDYWLDHRSGEIHILSEEMRDAINSIPWSERRANTMIMPAGYEDADGDPTTNATSFPIKDVGIRYSMTNQFQLIDGMFGVCEKTGEILEKTDRIFPGSLTLMIGDKVYREGFGEYQVGYFDEDGVYHKGENEFDFEVDYETGIITIHNMELMRDMRPGWLGGPDMAFLEPGDALHWYEQNNMYQLGQFGIKFDYIALGEDIYGDKVTNVGRIWRTMEEGVSTHINMGADEVWTDRNSGNDMVGVLLRYSQALFKDDRDGIQNALDELSTMYDTILNAQSEMGARTYRFELTHERNGIQFVDVKAQQSALEDADLAEVISRLLLAESVYQASLQAAMRVIQPSLANYM